MEQYNFPDKETAQQYAKRMSSELAAKDFFRAFKPDELDRIGSKEDFLFTNKPGNPAIISYVLDNDSHSIKFDFGTSRNAPKFEMLASDIAKLYKGEKAKPRLAI